MINMSTRQNKRSKARNNQPELKSEPKEETANTQLKKTAEEILAEVHLKNKQKAKDIAVYESSSEEEEINGDDLLTNIFKGYLGERTQLAKTQNALEETLQSGSAICLICIGSVKRNDPVWSCAVCFCIFHLQCVRRWANDSLLQQKSTSGEIQRYYNNNGELVLKIPKPLKWCCPKCRTDYEPNEVPSKYLCFCEKEVNPPYQPWLLPHSCGESCGKLLKPECGHKCVLLCHPGPCPPCPQNITVSCLCERSAQKTIRCFQKSWRCSAKCGLLLKCGIHVCEEICHGENCPPCPKKSMQKCLCQNQTSERKCSELVWQCNKVCNKMLACGRHKCKRICHAGVCGECPLGLPRSCPCGKSKSVAPCSEVIEPCGDTCQKALPCGLHYCAQRCHKGECSLCITLVDKKCRCGVHTKEMPCSKLFVCETKCKYKRECGKHVCNKKCCDGQCPPCDKVCGKVLSCKKHKCQSVCHDGPCYPCELKSQIKCRCGSAVISVPCGREKKARVPKCRLPCKIPSKCHHKNPHQCHMNECPPCSQICSLNNDVSGCIHPCQAKCHTAVRVLNSKRIPGDVWSWNMEKYVIKNFPHPRCEVKVEVTCIGGHDTELKPCWDSKARSCGRLCGRMLKCGNHQCKLICHAVPNININEQQEGCAECELTCEIKRPDGCIHPCKRRCHLPPCTPCTVTTKTNCHCGLTQVYFKCVDYYAANVDPLTRKAIQETLKSCGNPCIKTFPCGHSCTSMCHSGICPDPDLCRRKLKVYCVCKTVKVETTCDKYRAGLKEIPCNDKCALKKRKEEEERAKEEQKLKQLEEERNRLELEQFEKKFGRKKPRERKQIMEEKQANNKTKLWILFSSVAIIIGAVYIVFFIGN